MWALWAASVQKTIGQAQLPSKFPNTNVCDSSSAVKLESKSLQK
jgi:hypothetical protein